MLSLSFLVVCVVMVEFFFLYQQKPELFGKHFVQSDPLRGFDVEAGCSELCEG